MDDIVWADPRTGNLAWEFAGVLCTLGYRREVRLLSPSEAIGFWMWRYGGWSELSLEAAEGMGIVANAKPSPCTCNTLMYSTEHDATRACAWLNTLAECNELRLDTEVYACGDMWHCRAKPWDGGLEVTVGGGRITWKRVKREDTEQRMPFTFAG